MKAKTILAICAVLVLTLGFRGESAALTLLPISGQVNLIDLDLNPASASYLQGTARYDFTIGGGGSDFTVGLFGLTFLPSTFASFSIVSSDLLGLSAGGFGLVTSTSTLLPGNTFSITAGFTLTGLPKAISWGAGNSPWNQGFFATGTFDPGSGTDIFAGGESTFLTPEPGTLLLLGSGLFGFGLLGKLRRRCRG